MLLIGDAAYEGRVVVYCLLHFLVNLNCSNRWSLLVFLKRRGNQQYNVPSHLIPSILEETGPPSAPAIRCCLEVLSSSDCLPPHFTLHKVSLQRHHLMGKGFGLDWSSPDKERQNCPLLSQRLMWMAKDGGAGANSESIHYLPWACISNRNSPAIGSCPNYKTFSLTSCITGQQWPVNTN